MHLPQDDTDTIPWHEKILITIIIIFLFYFIFKLYMDSALDFYYNYFV